ncbi:hypothetical protein TUM17382_01410 [Shewanella algae]|nr:hypothetical protein TUM17382_01410 [Shewanella algae]
MNKWLGQKNAARPKFGSEEIRKDRMFCIQTGDLIYSECKYTSTRNEFVEAFVQKYHENDDYE